MGYWEYKGNRGLCKLQIYLRNSCSIVSPQRSSKLVSELGAPALLETSLCMQILRSHSTLGESATLGKGPTVCVLASLPNNADKTLKFEYHHLRESQCTLACYSRISRNNLFNFVLSKYFLNLFEHGLCLCVCITNTNFQQNECQRNTLCQKLVASDY